MLAKNTDFYLYYYLQQYIFFFLLYRRHNGDALQKTFTAPSVTLKKKKMTLLYKSTGYTYIRLISLQRMITQ